MHSDKAEAWRNGADVISPGFWVVSGVAMVVLGVAKMVSALAKIVSGVAEAVGSGVGAYLSVMTLTPRGLARMVVLMWPLAVRSCLTLTAP